MDAWRLAYDAFDPAKEALREALCTLGNGYFATRGAAPEATADDVHYPGTYLAGGYNRLRTDVAGRVVENEDLVNLPNWLLLTFRLEGGSWFDLRAVDIQSYRQELDLERGVLQRRVQFRDREGRETLVDSRRLIHMAEPHLGALELVLTPLNWSGSLGIHSAIDGRVTNAGVRRYRDLNGRHLMPLEGAVEDDCVWLKVQTTQSELRVAEAARTRVFRGDAFLQTERRPVEQPALAAEELVLDVREGSPVVVEKTVALYSSRDHAVTECGIEAREALMRAGRFAELLESQAEAWRDLWRRFEVEVEEKTPSEGERATLLIRLHVFHLLQTVSPNTIDLDVGVPARGLHGEAYRGHVFWDELFIFPFLNLRMPEITRALLKYRYRRLGAARAAAAEAGYRGAMYPWQSGSNGREETQILHLNPKSGRWLPDSSRRQRHMNAAVVYNVWHYYQVTRDLEFLSFCGAEMILEIARFWASVAIYDRGDDRYEIHGVMGPDEYHDAYPGASDPGLRNNAYTNVMAVWVLGRALELLTLLPGDRREELCERLSLGRGETERWERISRRMRVPFHGDGIISQFDGYDQLDELDWAGYSRRYGDIQRLDRILEAEGDSTNRYKVSKQADVLMLFYLFSSEELGSLLRSLGYTFDYETIPRNVRYYSQRTSHGSTLSRVVHSWVLARSDRPASWELFTEALESDVADIQGGTTHEGIHLGAMAGTADLIGRCYTGIETRGDVLWISPRLPRDISRLQMRMSYRGHAVHLDVGHDRLTVTAGRGVAEPAEIGFGGEIHELRAGESTDFVLDASA